MARALRTILLSGHSYGAAPLAELSAKEICRQRTLRRRPGLGRCWSQCRRFSALASIGIGIGNVVDSWLAGGPYW
jgi:hypothetical protein